MVEPEKPFACALPDCGMTFTNEDHLHVHTKKHDMILQLGSEQKGAFVADQTPTPTRFIRNCEEVGLFQDLQNVSANPFDEGFKRAMEAKHQGTKELYKLLCMETIPPTDDVLHTPQMVFPLMDSSESTLFTNSQRNVTISRSCSDESGTITGIETHIVSKLSNEITLSRIVSEDVTISNTDTRKDIDTLFSKNDVCTIKKNIITVDGDKETDVVDKEMVIDNNKLNIEDKVPIMSQKSIDFVVDNLTSELAGPNISETQNINVSKSKTELQQNDLNEFLKAKVNELCKKISTKTCESSPLPKILPKKEDDMKDYEVMIKLPNGTLVKMKPVESNQNSGDKRPIPSLSRNALISKVKNKINMKKSVKNKTVSKVTINKSPVTTNEVSNIVNIPPGRLIPVTLVNQAGAPLSNDDLNKVPITKIGLLPQQNSSVLNNLNASDAKMNEVVQNIRGTSACLSKVTSSENVTTSVVSRAVTTNANNVSNAPICRVTPIPNPLTSNPVTFTSNTVTLTANPGTLVSNGMTLTANPGTLVPKGITLTANPGTLVANGMTLAANSVALSRNVITLSANTATITPNSIQFKPNSMSTNAILTPNNTKPAQVVIKKGITQTSPNTFAITNRLVYNLNGENQTISPVANTINSPNTLSCSNATLTKITPTTDQIKPSILKKFNIVESKNETTMTLIVNGKPMTVTRLNNSTKMDVTSDNNQEKRVETHNERETQPNNVDSTYNIQVSQPYQIDQATGKRKMTLVTQEDINDRLLVNNIRDDSRDDSQNDDDDDDCVMLENAFENTETAKRTRIDLECRSAASKRYRARLKEAMRIQSEENKQLREANQKLIAEKAVLKLVIMEHMKQCPNAKGISDLINSLTTVIPDS